MGRFRWMLVVVGLLALWGLLLAGCGSQNGVFSAADPAVPNAALPQPAPEAPARTPEATPPAPQAASSPGVIARHESLTEEQKDARAVQDCIRFVKAKGLSPWPDDAPWGVTYKDLTDWSPDWELRGVLFRFNDTDYIYVWQATYRGDADYRYCIAWHPVEQRWIGWMRVLIWISDTEAALGQTVSQTVIGANPGSRINLYWIRPGQTQVQGPEYLGNADSNGTYVNNWNTGSSSEGTYASWVADGNTGLTSNRVEVTLGPSSQPAAEGNDILPGEQLAVDRPIQSTDGRFHLIFQSDGNLVLYEGGKALWAAGTENRGADSCVMQPDGNLVVYAGSEPLWASNTDGNPGSKLVLLKWGYAVILRPDALPLWASNMATGYRIMPGQQLLVDRPIRSPNGRYTLYFQTDGNLVLYEGGKAWWATGTENRGGKFCVMQSDGNLVIYTGSWKTGTFDAALWDSGTWGNSDSRLAVQDDRNVVIYRPDNRPVWATNTAVIDPPPSDFVTVDGAVWFSDNTRMHRFCNAVATHEGWKISTSRCRRNNNPGNLRSSPFTSQSDGGFAKFDSPQAGWQALEWDISHKATGNTVTGLNGDSTILDFAHVWAPSGDGNNPDAYARSIVYDRLGPWSRSLNETDGLTIYSRLGELL